ncbi:MAG: IS30 family transposase [Clostridia bacterium]|nr:IS30 family transposase [Clostridia bacterium]
MAAKTTKKAKKEPKFHHLSYTDRMSSARMHNGGKSIQHIADTLCVNYTTIYRELKRPGCMYEHLNSDYTTTTRYSADRAQEQYDTGKRDKGRPIKLGHDYELAQYIEKKIAEERRSPAAVLMDMELEGKTFDVSVCEKTIYNYVNGGVFLTVTNKNLPERGERKREYKQLRPSKPPKGESIERRPENINERVEPGHWEMDTVKGTVHSNKCALMLTERVSRHEIILPMYGCTMENVVAALNMLENKYGDMFRHVFRSITVDNGSEFQDYDGMRTSLNGGERTRVFYCHPYSSYERGSNENLNKMFRRIFPKGTNFDEVADEDIIAAADWMNNYPRKVLGRTTAAHRFNELLAAG